MIKYILITTLLITESLFSFNTFTKNTFERSNSKDFIFLVNTEDCVPCLVNTYNLASMMIDAKIPKEKIIFVLKNKRKIICENYKKDLKKIFDCDKITFLWNTELFEKIKRSINKQDGATTLLIYDNNKSKFIFNMFTKYVTPDKVIPYFANDSK